MRLLGRLMAAQPEASAVAPYPDLMAAVPVRPATRDRVVAPTAPARRRPHWAVATDSVLVDADDLVDPSALA